MRLSGLLVAVVLVGCGASSPPRCEEARPVSAPVTEEVAPGVLVAWSHCIDSRMGFTVFIRPPELRRGEALVLLVDSVPQTPDVMHIDAWTSTTIYSIDMTCTRHQVEVRGGWGPPWVHVLEPLRF